MGRNRVAIDYTRQLGIFDPSKHSIPITVIGAGGIGGPTTLALAKLGVAKIRVFDFDRVEAHNQPNQMYGLADLGQLKVEALGALTRYYADKAISMVSRRLRQSDKLSGVVIGAVDSMASRQVIWEVVQKNAANVPLYIDGRIGSQVVRVLSVRPGVAKDRKKYEKSLVPEHMVAPLPCTARGVIDVSFVVAALIARAYRLWCTDKERIPDLWLDHRNLSFLKG